MLFQIDFIPVDVLSVFPSLWQGHEPFIHVKAITGKVQEDIRYRGIYRPKLSIFVIIGRKFTICHIEKT